jgi:hypothetical protein
MVVAARAHLRRTLDFLRIFGIRGIGMMNDVARIRMSLDIDVERRSHVYR